MFDLTRLHDAVRAVAGDNLAIVVDSTFLEQMLSRQIRVAIAGISKIGGVPTTIRNVSISVAKVTPDPIPVSFQDDTIFVTNVSIDLTLHVQGDPTKVFSTTTIDFQEITAILTSANGKISLKFSGFQGTARPPVLSSASDRDAYFTLVGYNSAERASFERTEATIFFVSTGDIARALLTFVQVPDLLGAFTAFKFSGALLLKGIQDTTFGSALVITSLAGTELVRSECPAENAEPEIRVVRQSSSDPTRIPVDVTITPAQPLPSYNPGDIAALLARKMLLYLYLPQPVLNVTFGQRVMPGIVLSDSGDFGPVEWSYNVALLVKAASIKIIIDTPLPSLVLQLSLDIFAHADAWMQVGCVQVPLASADLTGSVDLVIRIVPYLDQAAEKLRFTAQVETKTINDIRVHIGSSFIPWPLSVIVDAIATDLAGKHLRTMLGRVVNLGRFDLADFSALFAVDRRFNRLSYHGVPSRSAIMGLNVEV